MKRSCEEDYDDARAAQRRGQSDRFISRNGWRVIFLCGLATGLILVLVLRHFGLIVK